MAKKCIEEFNPWPAFVDIFSSTILVLLLFMLILIVNIGYYAQFKFKISYTGTVSTENLILMDDPSEVKLDERAEKKKTDDTTVQTKQMFESVTAEPVPEVVQASTLESAGKQAGNQLDNNDSLDQAALTFDDHMVINFSKDEIILDDIMIKRVKNFIEDIKERFSSHKVYISAGDPKNQISATVAKTLSLSRVLNTRNLIRKLDYDKNDVKVKFIDENDPTLETSKSGYILIQIRSDK
jgi:hypothetical protein